MKAMLALALTFAAVSAQARWFMDSHYGKLTQHGASYSCDFTNKSNSPLDMKYVEFTFVRVGGHGDADFTVTNRIDKLVGPGQSISTSVRPNFAQSGYVCRYISRN
ncbi:MAG: hypothetical protein JSU04_19160 [Bdellovibrionales bacterium]|nr:hypothetical protein [Bdellovibrionales bacterium]